MTGERELTLTGHLGELRRSLLWCAVPFLLTAAAGFALSDRLLAWVFTPPRALSLPLHLIHPGDGLMLRIRAAVFLAAGPALVGLWARGRTDFTMLGAGAYFTMWETACLWAGLIAALAAAAPWTIHYLKRREAP